MSILNSIQEQTGNRRALPPTENFALQVDAYRVDPQGKDFIVGTRLDTGEEVSVYLRPYTGDKPLKAARAEVKDFIAKEGEISDLMKALPNDEVRKQVLKGQKAKTEPGGIILVQRAYTDRDGMVQAGWLQSAAKYPDHAIVIPKIMARVDPVLYRDKGPAVSTVTAINPDESQLVKSAEQLQATLTTCFAGEGNLVPGGRNGVLIRLTDGQVNKAIEWVQPRKKGEDDTYADVAPADSTAYFMASPTGKQLLQFVANPDVRIEVMPLAKLNIGASTKAGFEQNGGKLENVNRAYRMKKDEQEDTGFTESQLVLHRVGGGAVFTVAEPLSGRPTLSHARDVATAHHKGDGVTLDVKDNPSTVSSAEDEEEDFNVDDVVPQVANAASAPRMRM